MSTYETSAAYREHLVQRLAILEEADAKLRKLDFNDDAVSSAINEIVKRLYWVDRNMQLSLQADSEA